MKFIILTRLCLSVPPIFVMQNPSSHVGTCICIVSYISMSHSGRETRCSRRNLKSRLKSCFNNRHITKLFYERSGFWFTGYMVFKARNLEIQFTIPTAVLKCVCCAVCYQNIILHRIVKIVLCITLWKISFIYLDDY